MATVLDDAATVHAQAAARMPKIGVQIGGDRILAKRLDYGSLLVFALFGAVAGPWWILRHGLGWIEATAFAVGYCANMIGVGVGYHRFFTHRAFETSRPMQYAIGILAHLACQNAILKWAADHRRHHAHTDMPGDLHSPYYDGVGRPMGRVRGLYMAHFGWFFDETMTDLRIYGRGLIDDPVVRFCDGTRWLWTFLSLVGLPGLFGYAFGGWHHAVGAILVGGFLRLFFSLNGVLAVNSFGHVYGRERFRAHHAKNNWFLALLTLGDGWHNNHHEHPRHAMAGLRWWEIDLNGLVIHGLEKLGLVWNVQKISTHQRAGIPERRGPARG